MAENTPFPHGSFCWNELATTNAQTCRKFYEELFGWTSKTSEIGGTDYTVFKSGDKDIGGLMEMSGEGWGENPPPPHWMAYVAVGDVDAAVARVTELGGTVCVPPTDIPTVGRFSVINDPTGATISLMTLSGAQS